MKALNDKELLLRQLFYKLQWYTLWRSSARCAIFMMVASNGSIFSVTGPLWGEFTGHWWMNSPHKGQWCGALIFSLILTSTNGWANHRDAGDFRRHRAHYDVTVVFFRPQRNAKHHTKWEHGVRFAVYAVICYWLIYPYTSGSLYCHWVIISMVENTIDF